MSPLPPSILQIIEALQMLPSVGQKTAQRLAFFLIKTSRSKREKLGHSILNVMKNLRECEQCFHFSENPLCDICKNEYRTAEILCVVEDSLDLLSVEKTSAFSGKYHVLGGALAPLDGIGPDDIRIRELLIRAEKERYTEIILATNPTLEGESTAVYIQQKCAENPVLQKIKITRLARGIPVGGDVEYTDEITLARALENRSSLF